MLTGAVVFEFVQAVAGRELEVVEGVGGVDHVKLRQGALMNVYGQLAAALAVPDLLGFSAGE